MSNNIQFIILNFKKSSKMKIQVDDEFSDEVLESKGIKQGASLSPLLSIIVIDKI